jgi:hypothetical protein
LPSFSERLRWFLEHRPHLARLVSRWPTAGEKHLLSLLPDGHFSLQGVRLKRLLNRMLDETLFLSEFGVRSLSKLHEKHPYVFEYADTRLTVSYDPGDSNSGVFGGNSNWRGPIWMPMNFLIIEALQKFHTYYGDEPYFKVECPVGSGTLMHLGEIADELARRLCRIFLRDEEGRRTVFGNSRLEQEDIRFRDSLLFYESFHGDTGRGLGAPHSAGSMGLVALLLRSNTSIGAGRQAKAVTGTPADLVRESAG